MEIRKIQEGDNLQVSSLIRGILEDMGVPRVGTAYADVALDDMYRAYQAPKSIFFVIDFNGTRIACGGIAPLENYEGNICELQKMYVSSQHRGKKLASKILEACLESAIDFGYEGCYLETMPYMNAAQALYKKHGFEYLMAPLGDTGHTACSVRMLKRF